MRLDLLSLFPIVAFLLCTSRGAKPPQRGKQKLKRTMVKYSTQEDALIIKELQSRANAYDHIRTWQEIEEVHKQKVLEKVPGFSKPRSQDSFKKRFPKIVKKDTAVPDIVKKIYQENFVRKLITPEERDFINNELLSCDYLYSDRTWARIRDHHDRLRESGRLGFENKRTLVTLRTHFIHVMGLYGHIDQRIKDKFPQHFPFEGSASNFGENCDTGRNGKEAMECDEEDDYWGSIVADMQNLQRNPVDDHGVDSTLFVDPQGNRDNSIFEAHSPYELRKF